MKPCLKMKQIVEQLADKHGIDVSVHEAHFRLDLEGFDRLVVENMGHQRILVAHYFVQNGDLTPDPAIVFFIGHPAGWIPIGITAAMMGTQTYVLMNLDHTLGLDYDLVRQADLAEFADMWAQNLKDQGWLESGRKHVWDRPSHLPESEPSGRMTGCQSANHDDCYGELWQCSACGKIVCCAEGTDNHPELCDDCWANRYHAQPAMFSAEES